VNLTEEKLGKDTKGSPPHKPYPRIAFPLRSDCNNLDVGGTNVNA
jgi:hypothetical protein